MIKNKCVPFICVMYLSSVYADTIGSYRPSDESVLAYADIIAEVEVENILATEETSIGCFGYVYRARIKNHFKGEYSKDQIVTIGMNYRSFDVEIGQTQLVLINSLKSPNDSCPLSNGILSQGEEIFIFDRATTGALLLLNDEYDSEKFFRAVNCSSPRNFLFEYDLENAQRKEIVIDRMDCDELSGQYAEVLSLLGIGLEKNQ